VNKDNDDQVFSSIFKYFQVFFKKPKKRIICVCLNRIERMSLLCMFFIYRRCTPPDGLYGITDRSISVDRGLYGPIGIQEVFTFDS